MVNKALDFTYDTPFKQGIRFSEKVKEAEKTFLIFHRYIGCRACQIAIRELIQNYASFKEKNVQAMIVMQSTPGNVKASYENEEEVPFEIICDPDMKLYELYKVEAKNSAEELFRPCDVFARDAMNQKIQELKIVHGEYEGNECQLPSLFIVDPNMKIVKEHRAGSVVDMPSPKEMMEMIL